MAFTTYVFDVPLQPGWKWKSPRKVKFTIDEEGSDDVAPDEYMIELEMYPENRLVLPSALGERFVHFNDLWTNGHGRQGFAPQAVCQSLLRALRSALGRETQRTAVGTPFNEGSSAAPVTPNVEKPVEDKGRRLNIGKQPAPSSPAAPEQTRRLNLRKRDVASVLEACARRIQSLLR